MICQEKEHRYGRLHVDLLAAARGRNLKLPIEEARNHGLVMVLRQRTRRK